MSTPSSSSAPQVPRRLCIDFDGTLCDQAFPHIGEIKPGAREALALFRRMGFTVVIWSCRTCSWDSDIFGGGEPMQRDRVQEMIAWLDEHGIEYDEIDDGSRGKPGADLYIDDKGMRFMDDWPWIVRFVQWNLAHGAAPPTQYATPRPVPSTTVRFA